VVSIRMLQLCDVSEFYELGDRNTHHCSGGGHCVSAMGELCAISSCGISRAL
jgi:hypothetical protein